MCDPHPKLKENDIYCFFFNNSMGAATELVSMAAIKLLIIAMIALKNGCKNNNDFGKTNQIDQMELEEFNKADKRRGSQERKGVVEQSIAKMNRIFNTAFFVELMISAQIDILISAYSNIREFWLYPFKYLINSMTSLFMVFFYLWMMRKIIHRSIRLENYRKKYGNYKCMKLRKWRFLKSEYKDGASGLGLYIHEVFFVRDFLMCFFLVMFLDNPLIQILPTLFFYLISLGIQIVKQPFESKIMNFLSVINQSVYVIILVIGLILKLAGDKITLKQSEDYFGYFMIVISTVIVAVNIIMGLIDTLFTLRDIWRRYCSKEGKTKKDKLLGKKKGKEATRASRGRSQSNESELNLKQEQEVFVEDHDFRKPNQGKRKKKSLKHSKRHHNKSLIASPFSQFVGNRQDKKQKKKKRKQKERSKKDHSDVDDSRFKQESKQSKTPTASKAKSKEQSSPKKRSVSRLLHNND